MIYCVEDDASIRDLEVYTLCSTGFAAQGFRDGKELFEAIHKQKPELIVLDIMLPGDDGVQILHRLKNSSELSEIPVIMETAKSMEYDKIKTLDMGADDYLVMPAANEYPVLHLMSGVPDASCNLLHFMSAKRTLHLQI